MTDPLAPVRISVVTPTHNRPLSLLRLLHALRNGTFPASDFEAVIVADGCSDDTVARTRAEPLPFRLTVLEQNPGRGAAAARNFGAQHAKGELIVFLDDDIEPSRGLLSEHWREYKRYEEPTVVIGPPLPVRTANPGLHNIAAWGWWERQFAMMRAPGHRYTYDNVFSGNLSVPRSLFLEVGGFDVEFNSCRDDSEFGLRAMRHGARVTFASAATAWHHELRDAAALIQRKQAEGIADVRLARLYPDLWSSLRLSSPEQPALSALGIVRHLAFDSPRLGRIVARVAQKLLSLLEWARLRGTWRSLQAGLMYFWYWHAAARAMGGRAGLARLHADARKLVAEISAEQGGPFQIDLANGLEAAERALDTARPAHAEILWGPHYVGYVYGDSGTEPLGGRHLRAILAGDLAAPLTTVLATVAAAGSTGTRRANDLAVSVIIPAYNAASTLGEALDSLIRQTSPNWEAIVVNDGSTDETGNVAERYAARDGRIRVVHQANGGEGAARNTGLAAARHDWILFLDADDWMAPDALRSLTRAAVFDDTLDVVHGGWRRVTDNGNVMHPEYCFYSGDLFGMFARRCVLLIHSALVRRSVANAVGPFHSSKTCADWDFWQRVARTGARWGRVHEVVAFYRTRAGSASTFAMSLWSDGLRVVAQGHAQDPRVADPAHPNGAPREQLAAATFEYACWVAGLMIGQGDDPAPLLEDLRGKRAPGLNVEGAAQSILRTVSLVTGRAYDAWDELWPVVAPRIEAFLFAVERESGAKSFAMRTMRALEFLTLEYSDARRPFTRGGTYAFAWDVAQPMPAIEVGSGIERAHCVVLIDGARIGAVHVPVVSDYEANRRAVAQEIVRHYTWPILGWFLRSKNGPYSDLVFLREPGGIRVKRDGVTLATELSDVEAVDPSALHDRVGWNLFLQELWGRHDLSPGAFYEAQPDDPVADSRHVGSARLTSDVSEDLPPLQVDPSTASLELDVRVGGAPLGIVHLPVASGAVSPSAIRTAITLQSSFDLCRVAVREGVLGQSRDDDGSLRARLAARRSTLRPPPEYERVFPAPPNETENAPARNVIYDRHHFEAVFASATDPWSYVTPYEQFKYEQTLALIQPGIVPRALELACAEGRFTRQLAPRVRELLAMDISTVAIERAKARCADLQNVQFAQLDFIADAVPTGFDLVICSEVLYYLNSDEALLNVGAKLRDALTPGGRLILAHTNVAGDDPNETGLDWDVPFGGKRIGELLATVPDLRFTRELRTELYRIQVFERADGRASHAQLPVVDEAPHVAPDEYLAVRFLRPREKRSTESAARGTTNQRVPILMYHDIAPDTAMGPWRYRLSPNEFACQLEYLCKAGFRGVTLTEWSSAMHYRKPLPERSVIITFDDAYRSFSRYAFPLLREFGFPAIVFVPCAFVGRLNAWDEGIADQVPILDWDEIRQLAANGVDFGAHTMTHPHMTALSNADALREAAHSKSILERELGKRVTAFAYPYGDNDHVVQQLVSQCGYDVALTTRFERARFQDAPMGLPRIEVSSHDDLSTFIGNLGA